MSKPTFERVGNSFTFVWEKEHLYAAVDRIRQHTDKVDAEVTIQTTAPGVPPHLHQARVNLTSTSARSTLAKHLGSRLEDPDWQGIIEQLCVIVLREIRKGEPVIAIDGTYQSGPVRYVAQPFVQEGLINGIYGPGGSGKTEIACFISVLVAGGHERCGVAGVERPVLYCDYETTADDLAERVAMLQTGLNIGDSSQLHYRRCYQSFSTELESIQAIVADLNIGMIVIDPVGPASGGDTNSQEVICDFFASLRALKTTVLLIDHVAKGEDGKGKSTPYGSAYKINLCRNLWELRVDREQDEDEIRVGLFHFKVNRGKLLSPLGFSFEFQPDRVNVYKINPEDYESFGERLSLKSRIKHLLKTSDVPLSMQSIATELGAKPGSVAQTLSRSTGILWEPSSHNKLATWSLKDQRHVDGN